MEKKYARLQDILVVKYHSWLDFFQVSVIRDFWVI